MIISTYPQRSPEWHKERLGLPTASCFHKIITTTGNPSTQAEKYLYELVGEYLSGRPTERFVTHKMRMAVEREPDARLFYELIYDVEVQEVGLCYKDEQKRFGYSPDGLILEDGLLEIKDAEPHIQAIRLDKGWNKKDHWQQIQGGLFVSDRKWCDLMSYCEGMKPIIIRFERDEKFISKLDAALDKFCMELAMLVRKLKGV